MTRKNELNANSMPSRLGKGVLVKLGRGMGSNLYAQLVTVLIQLSSIPVIIAQWGVEAYGYWVAMMALPFFLSIAKFGVGPACENAVLTAISRGDGSNLGIGYIHSAWAFTIAISAAIMVVLCLFLSFGSFGALSATLHTPRADLSLITLFLVMYTVIEFYMAQNQVSFKAIDRYATGVFVTHSFRLVEQLFFLTVVVLGAGYLEAAATLCITRVVSTSIVIIWLHKRHRPYGFGVAKANVTMLRELLAPSFGFTIVPLSNALMIQGMVILSATYSGQAAAIFSATRVIIFAARQLALAGPRAVWPELTKSFSTENYESSQRLVGIAAIYMIAVFCGVILVLALCGEFIFCYLTGGKLVFDYALFGMLAICSALSSVSWMGYMIKGSTNNHGRFAIFGLLVAISIYVFSYLNRVEIYSWRIYLPLAGGELAIAILALSGSRDIVFGRNHRD